MCFPANCIRYVDEMTCMHGHADTPETRHQPAALSDYATVIGEHICSLHLLPQTPRGIRPLRLHAGAVVLCLLRGLECAIRQLTMLRVIPAGPLRRTSAQPSQPDVPNIMRSLVTTCTQPALCCITFAACMSVYSCGSQNRRSRVRCPARLPNSRQLFFHKATAFSAGLLADRADDRALRPTSEHCLA